MSFDVALTEGTNASTTTETATNLSLVVNGDTTALDTNAEWHATDLRDLRCVTGVSFRAIGLTRQNYSGGPLTSRTPQMPPLQGTSTRAAHKTPGHRLGGYEIGVKCSQLCSRQVG